MTIKA